MIFFFISIIVPVVVYTTLIKTLRFWGYDSTHHKPLLLIACGLFFISYQLPSPLIDGQNTSFCTHFVGGGIFCAVLWEYLKRTLKVKSSWQLSLIYLYFLVSGLGVANELFELMLYKLPITTGLTPLDTWWDLLANSLGAIFGWLIIRFISLIKKVTIW